MKINNQKVDVLGSEILSGSFNKKAIRGESYYAPISIAVNLNDESELKHAYISFDEIAELDKFINDMLLLRSTAIKTRGYYDTRHDPLSPIEDYINCVVNRNMGRIMYEFEKVKKEVEEQK